MNVDKTIAKIHKIEVLQTKVDADNEVVTCSGVRLNQGEGVTFVAILGKGEIATAVMKAQQDTVVGFGTAADLAGSNTNITSAVATDGLGILEIIKPEEEYLRPIVTVPNLGTARPLMVLAIHHGPARFFPETQTANVLVSPSEGTA